PPGAYTAAIEGASGASGIALLEVYQPDRGGGKLVNIAARGFADIGREMIGSFVVDAPAGATKRVLIRVLGPSLSRDFKLTNVLDDPFMELRGARGELLIQNDD